MEEKPKNFKEAALSHIPNELIYSMLKETKVETEGMGILEAIAKTTPKTSPLPQNSSISQTTQQQPMRIAVDGNVIDVAIDPFQGCVTMLMYLLATVWSKDKKIAKVLKQFNFVFKDTNGVTLYPTKVSKKKKR